jgi:glycerol kinase
METGYVLAIDQGTSSTKTIVFDERGEVLAKGSVPLKTWYLEGGFVEQEPEAIWQNVLDSVKQCLESFVAQGYQLSAIKTCGISNQRETFIVWDENGNPLHNAVVWQCKRSIPVCERLKAAGLESDVKRKTGLIIDPYFSGTKMVWLYENNDQVKAAVDAGKAYFGTVDTWLLYKLTGGNQYLTDHTNASRTLFFNLNTLQWDNQLLASLGLQNLNLPELRHSADHFGESDFNGLFNEPIAISAMIGDSHAAAFGEGCFEPGTAKATLGTGCSVLMNIGDKAKSSEKGMMTTVCWSIKGRVDYALEGVIVSCGATLEWLKNELSIIADTKQSAEMALSVADNNGVYLVPAFSGMGAPYWDMNRKAAIYGLTFDCNKNHVVRAGLESIAYQVKDVAAAMQDDAGIALKELMVNGGITSNTFVLQVIADLLDCKLLNRGIADVSALGAAFLAGLQAGIYPDLTYLKSLGGKPVSYTSDAANTKSQDWYAGWKKLFGQN